MARAWSRWAVLCLFGAILATGLDHAHVTHGVLVYPHPSLGDQAWWTPLLFGVSTLALLTQARLWRRPGDRLTTLGASLRVVDFAAAYFATSLLRDSPRLLALGLFVTWLAWVGRDLRQWMLGASIAIAGPVVESALCHAGAFGYLTDQPLLWMVPVWLPFLYLHVSLAARALDLAVLPAPASVKA